jgi:hypothetical protein
VVVGRRHHAHAARIETRRPVAHAHAVRNGPVLASARFLLLLLLLLQSQVASSTRVTAEEAEEEKKEKEKKGKGKMK